MRCSRHCFQAYSDRGLNPHRCQGVCFYVEKKLEIATNRPLPLPEKDDSQRCCCCSVTELCPTLCDPMDFNTPDFPVLHYLPEFAQIHIHVLVVLSNHLILCCPPLLLPSVLPSIRVFSSESALGMKWPKYWSFSISSSNEYAGLMSFRSNWFDLPPVQETLKSLLQHHNWKASILQHSACFRVQLSHLYMTTE